VDLLLVVDNSRSMQEEQQGLARQLPRLARSLVQGSVADGAGFPPIRDLHAAVLSTDLGAGNVADVYRCERGSGDDGRFRTRPGVQAEGCPRSYPPYLSYRQGDDVERFARRFSCLARQGTEGCNFEQPLEAALKALTPANSPTRFAQQTGGHGTGPHAGFARPDSLLVVVVLTDEDDCSVADPALFSADAPQYTPNLDLRCAAHPEALHEVERYVRGFQALRSRPSRLLFATVAGIPPSLGPASDTDYERLLEHERMQPQGPDRGHLEPSCEAEETGRAYPPRRLVRVARGLQRQGSHSMVASLCGNDFAGVVGSLGRRIGELVRQSECATNADSP
jgi:hypothetical protein